MTNLKTSLIALLAAAAPIGCSGSPTPSAPAKALPVTVNGSGGLEVPGDGPVTTRIVIDRTAIAKGSRLLAEGYRSAALQTAQPTIQRGGNLTVEVFGRVSRYAVTVYQVPIPTLAEVGPAARDDQGETAKLDAVLSAAVGLAEAPTPRAEAALRGVTDGNGSDIGRMVGQSIASVADGPADARIVFVATDGWIHEDGQPTLARELAAGGSRAGARMIVDQAGAPETRGPVSMLRMVGLGSTSGRRDPDSAKVDPLVRAWATACRRLPVATCQISPQT